MNNYAVCMKVMIGACLLYTMVAVVYDFRYEAMMFVKTYIKDINIPTSTPFPDMPKMKRFTEAVNTDRENTEHVGMFLRGGLLKQKVKNRTTPIVKHVILPNKSDAEEKAMTVEEKQKYIDQILSDLNHAIHTLMHTEKDWLPQMQYENIEHIESGFERANLVKERCGLLRSLVTNSDILHMKHALFENHTYLVHQNLNLSLCINCKVASTAMKEFLATVDHQNISWSKSRQYAEKSLFKADDGALSPGYLNVTFVREPLERLLSAYNDDKAFRGKIIDRSTEKQKFETFLSMALNRDKFSLNRHIFLYTLRCHPCYVDYNFVGMQSTFNDDLLDIMVYQHIPKEDYEILPRDPRYKQHSEDVVQQFYKDIPDELIHRMWEMYYLDYFIFGFPYPSHLMSGKLPVPK